MIDLNQKFKLTFSDRRHSISAIDNPTKIIQGIPRKSGLPAGPIVKKEKSSDTGVSSKESQVLPPKSFNASSTAVTASTIPKVLTGKPIF